MQPVKPHNPIIHHITTKPTLPGSATTILSSNDIKGLFSAELIRAAKTVSRTESTSVNSQTNANNIRSGVFMPSAATGISSGSASGSKHRTSANKKRDLTSRSKPATLNK